MRSQTLASPVSEQMSRGDSTKMTVTPGQHTGVVAKGGGALHGPDAQPLIKTSNESVAQAARWEA
jgi:hypothetical protein